VAPPSRRPPNSPGGGRFKRNDQRNWFDPGNDCQKVANITSRADSAEFHQRAGCGTAARAFVTRTPGRWKNTPRGGQRANLDSLRPYRQRHGLTEAERREALTCTVEPLDV
jgi:hypothetical protein